MLRLVTKISLMDCRGLGDVAGRFSDRASLQLSLTSTKLHNNTHIPRGQCVAQVLAGFDERQLVIVTGGPGAGKSAVIAELAPLLRESGPLFFFRADELDEPSLAAVQSLSGMPDVVLSMANLVCSGTPTVVIDSLEKALEARNPGALEELLALVRQNKGIRLCVTTRSYALNALYSLFLADFSYQVVDVPLLTDAEISEVVAGTALEDIAAKDGGVREVLRAPYYLRLAFSYTAAGAVLPQAAGNDLRLRMWTERVAPSRGLPAGLVHHPVPVFISLGFVHPQGGAQVRSELVMIGLGFQLGPVGVFVAVAEQLAPLDHGKVQCPALDDPPKIYARLRQDFVHDSLHKGGTNKAPTKLYVPLHNLFTRHPVAVP